MKANPFTKQPVYQNDFFCGRTKEVNFVLDNTCKGISSSIIGEQKIGKSSLLKRIEHLINYYRNCPNEVPQHLPNIHLCQCIYIHFDTIENQMSLDSFIELLFNKLQLQYNKEDGVSSISYLEETLDKFEKKIVILFDSFESILNKSYLSNDATLNHLKVLGEKELCTFVTSTETPLKNLSIKHGLTSSFYNIFKEIALKGFSKKEIENFSLQYWGQYWEKISKPEKELLLSYHKPIALQIASSHVYENKWVGYSINTLKKKIEKDWQVLEGSPLERALSTTMTTQKSTSSILHWFVQLAKHYLEKKYT